VFLFANFFSGLGHTVIAPLVLARSDMNPAIFGSVQSIGAVGGIVGGVVLSAWGGFKRRVHGVLLGWIISGVCGEALFGLGHTWPIWAVASFIGAAVIPLVNGSNQAIWQAKVAPDLQGRVFAARRLIAWLTTPITPLIAGPLADFVLGPAMRPGGGLAATFGWLVGNDAGSGMALIVIFSGLTAAAVGLLGYLFTYVRDAEQILPDHDAAPVAAGAD
jgi:hypothetical protein